MTGSCLATTRPPAFESRQGHVKRLPVTFGKVVVSLGTLVYSSYNLLVTTYTQYGIKSDNNQNSKYI